MGTYVRVVGFEDDGAKIVERAQSALDEAAFPQLDFMVFGCSEYRGHIAECFKLDDFSTRVDHKLLLLVTRVDGPAVGSIIPVFYKCAKNSGWDMGVIMLRSENRPDNGLPKWTDLPKGHCDFFTVLSMDASASRKYYVIASLVYLLKDPGVSRTSYEDFMEIFGDGEELKFERMFAANWIDMAKDEIEACVLQVEHDSEFTMDRMQRLINAIPEGINSIVANFNDMEEDGCPAIVHLWYKKAD